ncbi:transcription factor HES-5-like isoform X1 [Bufo gargarizans]|uniref:transcription factor HES-5-like isoform X1 n=1 Tax=Bufo gargarizans TaxID=30331 RepID=UPI001CF146F6|nr:transcription factor HES-5-like isoform X1 [Bufo gargarizans]
MAPYSVSLIQSPANDPLTQQPRKLRKPVIEKMRRDRINSSIEQLRILLEKEFQRHQLPSKPEKADILEMTVTYLQHHMAERNVTASSQAQREGFSTCVQDSITFLSQHKQTELQIQLLQNLPGAHTMTYGAVSPPVSSIHQTPSKHSPLDSSKALWRPW